jgi:hypothetical protein
LNEFSESMRRFRVASFVVPSNFSCSLLLFVQLQDKKARCTNALLRTLPSH